MTYYLVRGHSGASCRGFLTSFVDSVERYIRLTGGTKVTSSGVVLSPKMKFNGACRVGLRVVSGLRVVGRLKCPMLLKASEGSIVNLALSLPMRRHRRKAVIAAICKIRGNYTFIHIRSIRGGGETVHVAETLVERRRM